MGGGGDIWWVESGVPEGVYRREILAIIPLRVLVARLYFNCSVSVAIAEDNVLNENQELVQVMSGEDKTREICVTAWIAELSCSVRAQAEVSYGKGRGTLNTENGHWPNGTAKRSRRARLATTTTTTFDDDFWSIFRLA